MRLCHGCSVILTPGQIAPFFSICPPTELLPVLGLLDQYMTTTLDGALLCSSRAGYDLGHKSDRLELISLKPWWDLQSEDWDTTP